jgi:hypothetical protein
MRLLLISAAALCALRPLAAQDTAIVIQPESAGLHFTPPELPHSAVLTVVRAYNARATTRLVGRASLPAGNAWRGDVAIRNGPALIGGRVEGSLLVINGNAVLDSSAAVTGSLTVVGGTIIGPRSGVAGEIHVYAEPLPYRLAGDTLVYAQDLLRRLSLSARYTFGNATSRSSLVLATSGTFNRVEGLPIVAGPTVDLALRRGLGFRAAAMGVFRTAHSISGECCDLGYHARAELVFGNSRPIGLTLRAFDLANPVEDWGLHANEVGWEAFLVRRDYRDYFRGSGVAARLGWRVEAPLDLSFEIRRERESTLRTRDPWTLSRTSIPWRPNPPIDNGHYTSLMPAVTLDSRNNADQPTSGWYLRGSLEFLMSDDVRPVPDFPGAVRDSAAMLGEYRSTRGFFDLRRYNKLSPQGRLNFRFVLAGWLGGDPLTVQRRLSIGGPEPLPGYEFREGACNALASTGGFAGTLVAACDRVVMVQTEYRGHINLRTNYNPETGQTGGLGYMTRFLRGPDFVVFGDAGQGWLVGRGPGLVPSGQLPRLSSWLADLGLGIDWGGFGVYVAKAVNASQPLRLTARLEHRF